MEKSGREERHRPGLEPIAICGMSMRLPGGVRCAETFWQALLEKRELLCTVPDDRFNVDAFYSPHGKPGTIISPEAFYLTDAELGHFDTSMFKISPHELRHIDPQLRMLLEITHECLENAGEVNWRGKQVGCYVGTFGEDWYDLGAKDSLDAGMYRAAGASDFGLSNRISYEYDFRGPSMTIKSACSAALMGLNEACWAINTGQCDSAIVAASNLIMTPTMTISMGSAALSPTGTCKTFDAAADGYARGEAVNAIYVKRLSDALADGNAIRAVIRGIGANSDGQTSTTLTPSLVCQESLIRQTYAQAGLSVDKTGFFECHGTGTRVGDPIEAGAVDRIFGDYGVHIGAVKPNFGHSEGASAITSIIKAILCLEKRKIPPNMRFSTPNPAIPWGHGRLKVPIEATTWPADREDRVSVNSFGIGGANGHVIIDSARKWTPKPYLNGIEPEMHRSQLLVLSATHEKSLARLKSSYETLLSAGSIELGDLAYTLGTRRVHHRYRAFCTASPNAKDAKFSTTARPPRTSQLVFVFSGQGSTWHRMAETLIQQNIPFRQTLDRLDNFLSSLPECKFSLQKELLAEKQDSRLQDAELSQPLITAIQICLCNALRAVGVQPIAVVGHSSGEIAAAYVSGALTEEDAMKVAFYRGQAIALDTTHGAMTSVSLGRDVVKKLHLHGATLACDNSPSSVTLSGNEEQIEAVETTLEDMYPNALLKRVQVNKAYHSHHMKLAGETYERMLSGTIRPRHFEVPYYSALTGCKLEGSYELGPRYWRQHLEGSVSFRAATEAIASDLEKDIIFAEIGPHPTLTGFLIQSCTDQNVQGISHVSFMRRSNDTASTFLDGLGRLYQLGLPLDLQILTPGGKTLTDLPNYAWNHETVHWNETRIGREWRFRKYSRHDLLGVRVGESSTIEPSWRNMLRLDDVGWIRHHRVESDVVLPFTAFCTMAGEAVQQIHHERTSFSLRRVHVGATLTLEQSDAVEIITTLRPAKVNELLDSSWYEFKISSFDGSRWIKHCTGAVMLGRDPMLRDETYNPSLRYAREIDTDEWYSTLAGAGLHYGAKFQRLQSISADVREPVAAAVVEDDRSPKDSTYEMHPATLDSTVQLIGVAASRGLSKLVQNLFIPVSVDKMYIAAGQDLLSVRAEAEVSARGTVSGRVVAFSNAKAVLQMQGLILFPMEGISTERTADSHAAAEVIWTPDLESCTVSAALNCGGMFSCDSVSLSPGPDILEQVVRLMALYNPLSSVLELGTTSYKLAERVLAALETDSGDRLYSTFAVGRPSNASRDEFEEKFRDVAKAKYTVLELAKNTTATQAHHGSYDLIVVDTHVLSEETTINTTLSNIRQLALPGARLIFHNHDSSTQAIYENGDAQKSRWNADVLAQAGFSNIERLGDTLLVARVQAVLRESSSTSIALLCSEKDEPLVHRIISLCAARDIQAEPYNLEDLVRTPDSQKPVLSLLDLQGKSELLEPSSKQFGNLLAVFQSNTHGIVWLTKPHPDYATVIGLARTARNELHIPFYTLEAPDIQTAATENVVMDVLVRCLKQPPTFQDDWTSRPGKVDPDFEFAIRQGCVQVQRFQWKNLMSDLYVSAKERRDSRLDAPHGRLRIGKIGRLETLEWKLQDPRPMQNNYVEVRIKAVGVNFKDILVSLGVVDIPDNALGLDGAGVVTQIGDSVKNLKVGDSVMLCGTGTFAAYIRGPEYYCCKIPDTWSYKEAATMLCVFMTAMYALMDLAKLEKGESVLIHSGCGGVGLAAIQLAQMIGAEIFVTVGSEEKVEHLVENYGIRRDHISNSRSTAFYLDIMRQTSGRGVDVVLNSLSGELLHASWRCVAKFGRMVEIGKRDMLSFGKLDLDLFEGNRTYVGMSLDEILEQRPNVAEKLTSRLLKLIEDGSVKPISPITTFPATDVRECFNYMQQGKVIGKIVVEIPDNIDDFCYVEQAKQLSFDPTASYLLVGGLGGLGRAIARWMVEKGAAHLIFLSRTAGLRKEHAVFLEELGAMGAVCTAIAGDVSSKLDVENIVTAAVPPIKGVVQASMVLKDVSLPNMTVNDWNEALEPKVKGTWNLHNSLIGTDLDFFVVLGSLSGVIGQHGQANYNAANSFLNAFVQHRHRLGLAASMLNLSAVQGIGVLSKKTKLISHMKEEGAHILREQEVLEAFHWAVENSKPWQHQQSSSTAPERGCISLGLRSSIALEKLDAEHPWKRDRRAASYHNSQYAAESHVEIRALSDQDISQRLLDAIQKIHADPGKELADPTTSQILAEEIAKKAFKMLLRPEEEVDITTALLAVGLDSLMAMQLRQWWRTVFKVEVNMLQLANAKTFEGLGLLAVNVLRRKLVTE